MDGYMYLVPLSAVVGGLLMPVLIILVALLFAYLRKKCKYHLAELMVEKGLALPENFFEKKEQKEQIDSSVKLLKNGLIFLAVGIGAAFFGIVKSDSDILALSSIPALVGVAYLIVSFVVKKKEDKAALAEKTDAPETEPEN